jgi:hypothetical protein
MWATILAVKTIGGDMTALQTPSISNKRRIVVMVLVKVLPPQSLIIKKYGCSIL